MVTTADHKNVSNELPVLYDAQGNKINDEPQVTILTPGGQPTNQTLVDVHGQVLTTEQAETIIDVEPVSDEKPSEQDNNKQDLPDIQDLINQYDKTEGIKSPSVEDYKPLGLDTEEQILSRVKGTDVDQFFKTKDNGEPGSTFDVAAMSTHLVDECGFRFKCVPGDLDDNIRFFNNGTYITDNAGVIGKAIYKLVGDKRDPGHVDKTIRDLKVLYRHGDVGSSVYPGFHPDFLNCADGMLHYRSGTLYPHEVWTDQTGGISLTQFPVQWNGQADCSEFDKFLLDKVGSQEMVDFIYEVFGITMLQYVPFQKCFVFMGKGNTGKSTTLQVLRQMLGGKRNVSSVTWQDLDGDGVRFKTSKLTGRVANIVHESSVLELDGSGNLKQIVDGQTMDVEEKFIASFQVTMFATLFAASNVPVKTKDKSGAFHKRLIVIPFGNPHKEISGYERRFFEQAVLNGVFQNSVKGLNRALDRGELKVPSVVEQAGTLNKQADDEVKQWLVQNVNRNVIDPNTSDLCQYKASDLYDVYSAVMKSQNMSNPDNQVKVASKISFNRSLGEWTGYGNEDKVYIDNVKSKRTFPGVVLNDNGYTLADKLGVEVELRDTEIK